MPTYQCCPSCVGGLECEKSLTPFAPVPMPPRLCRFCERELPPGIIDVEHGCAGAEGWIAERRARALRGDLTYAADPVLGAWAEEKRWSPYPWPFGSLRGYYDREAA
jgi:hypothetical protein